MTNPTPFSLSRHGKLIPVGGTPVFNATSVFGQEVAVHVHEKFGHCLYIDGEIQISELDFEAYHSAMLEFVPAGKHILVIGDGDGGFTNRPDWLITQVEPDEVVMQAAEQFFHANWSSRDQFSLRHCTLQQYVEDMRRHRFDDDWWPARKIDALFLAITDEFNSDASNFSDVVWLWDHALSAGGKLVAQVGCVDDPNYAMYLNNYTALSTCLGVHSQDDTKRRIECFHSDHHFRCLTKG